ncbi:MAG: MFS transporter, partial [Motilibacteraceae bacterium]
VGTNARQVLAARWFGSEVGRFSGLSSALTGATAAAGGGLAALLVAAGSSLRPMFAVDAATFAVAALMRALLTGTGARAARTPRPGLQNLPQGFGILTTRGVGALVGVFCLVQLAEAVAARMFVPVVLTVFAAPAGWVPLLEAVGVVSALGGVAVVPYARRLSPRPSTLLAGTLPGLAVVVAAYGLVPHVQALVPLEALLAVLGTVAGAALVDALVLVVPRDRHGQAFAALLTVGNLAQAGALVVLGVSADRLGLRTTLVLGGVPLLAAVPLALSSGRAPRRVSGPAGVDDLASRA